MKFATLALIGAVSAYDEETELVGKRWDWRHVGPLMEQEGRVMESFMDIATDKEMKKAWRKMGKGLEATVPKYIPYLQAWGESSAVKAKQAHDMKMWTSKKGQRL